MECDLLFFYFTWKGRVSITGDKSPKKREKKKRSAFKPIVEQAVPPAPELIKKPKKQ